MCRIIRMEKSGGCHKDTLWIACFYTPFHLCILISIRYKHNCLLFRRRRIRFMAIYGGKSKDLLRFLAALRQRSFYSIELTSFYYCSVVAKVRTASNQLSSVGIRFSPSDHSLQHAPK